MFKKSFVMSAIAASCFLFSSCEKDKPVESKITFEELPVNGEGLWNGSDGSGGFSSDNAFFPNSYNQDYNYWGGFSYSNHTNNTTRGYTNQYSSIAGEGAGGSAQYAVLYSSSATMANAAAGNIQTTVPDTITFIVPEKIKNISFCNSTYSYFTMKEGDAFTSAFGGDDGNAKDYFNLHLAGLDDDKQVIMTAKIALADYTNDNNSLDWIGNVWTDVDLSQAGYIKHLLISFESSDVGLYGINTPTYVCIDNIIGELKD
jgi:hypothetical protein